jgi:hypothetical protein
MVEAQGIHDFIKDVVVDERVGGIDSDGCRGRKGFLEDANEAHINIKMPSYDGCYSNMAPHKSRRGSRVLEPFWFWKRAGGIEDGVSEQKQYDASADEQESTVSPEHDARTVSSVKRLKVSVPRLQLEPATVQRDGTETHGSKGQMKRDASELL